MSHTLVISMTVWVYIWVCDRYISECVKWIYPWKCDITTCKFISHTLVIGMTVCHSNNKGRVVRFGFVSKNETHNDITTCKFISQTQTYTLAHLEELYFTHSDMYLGVSFRFTKWNVQCCHKWLSKGCYDSIVRDGAFHFVQWSAFTCCYLTLKLFVIVCAS